MWFVILFLYVAVTNHGDECFIREYQSNKIQA